MASYASCYYKGTSRGKNVQVQISQTELNLVLSMVVDVKGVPIGITVDARNELYDGHREDVRTRKIKNMKRVARK
jgi:hypothetical protein